MKLLFLVLVCNSIFAFVNPDSISHDSVIKVNEKNADLIINTVNRYYLAGDSVNAKLWMDKLQTYYAKNNPRLDNTSLLDYSLKVFNKFNSINNVFSLLELYLVNPGNLNEPKYLYYYNKYTDFNYLSANFSNNVKLVKNILVHSKLINNKLKVVFYKSLSQNYLQLGEVDSAKVYAEQNIKLREFLKDTKSLSSAYNIIGVLHWKTGDIYDAYINYSKAFEYSVIAKDTNTMVLVLNNLGLIFQRLKYFEIAESNINKALKLAQDANYTFGVGYSYKRFADLLLDQNKFDAAKVFIDKADEVFGQLKRSKDVMDIYYMYGKLYQMTNKPKVSLFYLDKAITKAILTKDKFVEALAALKTSEVNYSLNNFTTSITFAEQALSIAKKQNYNVIVRDCYEILYKSYKKLNYTSQALFYLENFQELKDKVINETIINSINENSIRKTIQQSEIVKEKLKKENELQKTIISNNQFLQIIYTVVILIVLVGSIIIIVQMRRQKKLSSTIDDNNKKLVDYNNTLENTNKELKDANQTKNKLFSIIAHDLKNPFVSILGFASLISEYADGLNDLELKKLSETLLASSRNLVELIDNLSKWSSLHGQKIKPDFISFDLIQTIKETINQNMINFQLKQIKIETEIESEVFIYADKEMTATIVRNLISNAIKFTPTNGKIKIVCKEFDDKVQLSIIDNGVGISQDKIAMLEAGNSVESSTGTSNEKGTGLGLTICREFIKANEGTLSINSTIGEGSEFIISFQKQNGN